MYHRTALGLSGAEVDRILAAAARLDIRPGPGGSRFAPWDETDAALADEPSLAPLRPWVRATVVALYPSAQLVGHADPPIVGRRYHVPIQANDQCWTYHAGEWRRLALGGCYRMDPTEVHGAVNWGREVRLHLVVDTLAEVPE